MPLPSRSPGCKLQPLTRGAQASAPASSTRRGSCRATGAAAACLAARIAALLSCTSTSIAKPPSAWSGVVRQVRQRRGITGCARERRAAKRRQRLERDHPRRNRGREALRQERPERLVLPGLDVARRPVAQQHGAEHVLARVARSTIGCAERIAGADEEAELDLVVEAPARAERGAAAASAAWSDRSVARMAVSESTTGRSAAVIADRHPFVVRRQRVVGAEQAPNVGRMKYRCIEIGEVADRERQQQLGVGRAWSDAGRARADSHRCRLRRRAARQTARGAVPSSAAGRARRARSGSCRGTRRPAARAAPPNPSASAAAATSSTQSPIATPNTGRCSRPPDETRRTAGFAAENRKPRRSPLRANCDERRRGCGRAPSLLLRIELAEAQRKAAPHAVVVRFELRGRRAQGVSAETRNATPT